MRFRKVDRYSFVVVTAIAKRIFFFFLFCFRARRFLASHPASSRTQRDFHTADDDEEDDDDDDSPIARSDTDHEEGREGRRHRQKILCGWCDLREQ